MNRYNDALMRAPSFPNYAYCVVCGMSGVPIGRHHPARRSQGGTEGPTIPLCPECHKAAHDMRLHFAYRVQWEFIRGRGKYEDKLLETGWRRVPGW